LKAGLLKYYRRKYVSKQPFASAASTYIEIIIEVCFYRLDWTLLLGLGLTGSLLVIAIDDDSRNLLTAGCPPSTPYTETPIPPASRAARVNRSNAFLRLSILETYSFLPAPVLCRGPDWPSPAFSFGASILACSESISREGRPVRSISSSSISTGLTASLSVFAFEVGAAAADGVEREEGAGGVRGVLGPLAGVAVANGTSGVIFA
jgi:hypothetical protein